MAASSLFGGKHATFWINQRYFSPSKVCGFHRIGVRHAPFGCAPYSVLLCDMRRFMHQAKAKSLYLLLLINLPL
jgi:hypothetical protein